MKGWSLRKTLATLIITIVGGLIIYSAIGIFMNVTNTAIYDQTPLRIYHDFMTPDYTFNVQITNDDPLPIPYLAPFYTMSVNITGGNGTYAYFTGIGGESQPLNFTDWSMDVGRIDSGGSRTEPIMIHFGSGSFTMRVDAYLHFLFEWKASSVTYLFEAEGNNYYNITRTK